MRAALLAFCLSGCFSVCPTREALTDSDGGQLPCVVSVDCPRPSNVLVCGATEDRLRDCVACEETECVRYRAEACK
ncbi:MAG: hypothetical protein JNG84_00220 [Archangium sp.]|nr:hypothetical protein [Archangium sp.]